jgi:hypothetical protein
MGKPTKKKKKMKPLPEDTKCGMVNQHQIDVEYKKSKQIKETDVFDKKSSTKPKKKRPDKPREMPNKNKTIGASS